MHVNKLIRVCMCTWVWSCVYQCMCAIRGCGEYMYMRVCVCVCVCVCVLDHHSSLSPILNDPLHDLVCGNPVTTVHHLQNTHPLGHLQML